MGQRRELVERYIPIDAWPNHCVQPLRAADARQRARLTLTLGALR